MDLAYAAGDANARSTTSRTGDGTDSTVGTVGGSFEQFYVAHRAAVGRALALTLRDTDLASDAVDEAMARAYERWAHVRTLDNPVGWVYRVGLNWSRSLLRRATRQAPIWLHAGGGADGSTTDPAGIDPAVDRALGELTVDQRAVVICRLLIGYSEAQTAQALGIRPGTVKSRLNRATTRLQTSLSHLHPMHQQQHDTLHQHDKDDS